VERLDPPLAAIPDDPNQGGTPGHVAIAPIDQSGQMKQELLNQWTVHRDDIKPFWLTQIVLDAIIGEERGGRS